jgi:hypothetical protein
MPKLDATAVFGVIPDNPGSQSGVARSGNPGFESNLDTRVRGYDEK